MMIGGKRRRRRATADSQNQQVAVSPELPHSVARFPPQEGINGTLCWMARVSISSFLNAFLISLVDTERFQRTRDDDDVDGDSVLNGTRVICTTSERGH